VRFSVGRIDGKPKYKSRYFDGRKYPTEASVRTALQHKVILANSAPGRVKVDAKFREIIEIYREKHLPGLEYLSERIELRWIRRAPGSPEPAKRWTAFLSNHREAIAAMDFSTVPTLTFGVLYCFFVIAHDRRRILQCQVTSHPTSAWVIQQLREAFPCDSAPGCLTFDRGPQFNGEVIETVKSFNIQPKRTSFRSPWQNGVAERWVGNCRRD
jgi:transposase InsO family protein